MKARYEVTIRLGRRILDRKWFNKVDEAYDFMDFVENRKDKLYAIGSSVEFIDHNPFCSQV